MKEKILRLLKSSNKQDIVLAFHLMEDWTCEEITDIVPLYYGGGRMKCNYTGDETHFFLRAKCGLIFYASQSEGIGMLPRTAYGDNNYYNIYEEENY